LLIALFAINLYDIKKSNVLLAVFDKYSCDTVQGNINTIARLNKTINTQDDMQKEVERILFKLGIKNKVQVDINENDAKLEYMVTRSAKDSETIVKIESRKNENQEIKETYLSINTILYEKIEDIGYVQTLLDNIYKGLELDYDMNITVVGRYKGKIDKKQQSEYSDKILKSMKAKKVDSFETDNIYSVYGYTGYIKDFIIQGKNKVNVNIAMRYNDYEDKTYLYISTPIITADY